MDVISRFVLRQVGHKGAFVYDVTQILAFFDPLTPLLRPYAISLMYLHQKNTYPLPSWASLISSDYYQPEPSPEAVGMGTTW